MTTAQIPKIESTVRQQLGSREALRLRQGGQIPAVIYGHKQDPVHVSVDLKVVTDLLHHHAHLIEVDVGGQTESCLIKDVQWDHLGSKIIHIDLARVDLTEQVTVDVDIEFTGDAVGLKESGAYIEHPTVQLAIQCLATNIPDSIKVDVTDLNVGASITVGDLKLPEGVAAVDDPDTVLAVIHKAAEEEEDTEATGETEPELIRKKSDEGVE